MFNSNIFQETPSQLVALCGIGSLTLRPELPMLSFDDNVSALTAEAAMLKANRVFAESLPGNGRYVEDIDLKNPYGTRFVILCDDKFYNAFLETAAEEIVISELPNNDPSATGDLEA